MNPSSTFFLAKNQRLLIIWFLCHWATVMTACFVTHSTRLSTLSLCLKSLRNRTPSNLKLYHIKAKIHRNYFFWQEDEVPLANEALCLSTPKHNGKSGTVSTRTHHCYYDLYLMHVLTDWHCACESMVTCVRLSILIFPGVPGRFLSLWQFAVDLFNFVFLLFGSFIYLYEVVLQRPINMFWLFVIPDASIELFCVWR